MTGPWAIAQDGHVELRGERVFLRPVRTDDVAALSQMFSAPSVAAWWVDFDQARIERELLNNDEDAVTVFAIEVEGETAGVVQCYEEPDRDYRAAALDIAVAPQWWGHGVAVDAIRTLARDLIERGGHHHLTIDPAADNARAIACYAKVGFKPVGVLRRNERGPDGTYHDTLLMDLVAEELT
jgi:aminoglycoside 6'-N-acetyltransferase